mmetsp:Transcript_10506/g.30698  ORF Transcript_10506/g.30698 Transcript_10506/m.30698 type:complete len:286 (-) Transcript_10506:526-1383(-)
MARRLSRFSTVAACLFTAVVGRHRGSMLALWWVVLGADARAREEEVAAVVGGAFPWPNPIRQLKAARPGRVREAYKLGHRVAHRLPAQPRTDVYAGGEEARLLAAVRGARLYVDNSVARPPSEPRDAAARAHVVGLAREVAVGIDDDVVPCGGIVRTSPLSQPRDECAAGGRSRDLQIAIHLNVVAQIAAAFRDTVLAATVVKIVEAAACLDRLHEAPTHSRVDVEEAKVEPVGHSNRCPVRVVRVREPELESCVRVGGNRNLAQAFALAPVAHRAPRRVLGLVG